MWKTHLVYLQNLPWTLHISHCSLGKASRTLLNDLTPCLAGQADSTLLLSRPSPHCNLALFFFIILLSHKLLQWSPFIMMKIKIPESNLQPSLLLFNSMNCLSHWLWFSPISYLSLLQLSSLSWILSHANSIPDMMGSFFSFVISLNVISSVSPSQILVNIHFLHSSVIIFGDTFVSWSPVSL